MQTIRIFLSASVELEQEKLELADLIENLNNSLEHRGTSLLMYTWDSAVNEANDFDAQLGQSDLCLTLYYTSFNDNAKAELEKAYKALCEGKNPKKIYVYFKENDQRSPELENFRKNFSKNYGHFHCKFANVDTLKADFLLQFMEYQNNHMGEKKLVDIRNGKVTIEGKEYVNLQNVPFAGNNEEYNLLLKSIRKTEKLLAITEEDDDEYMEYAQELYDLKEKRKAMESSLWNTALTITRLCTTKCSECSC